MSRIGKRPVVLPDGVNATLSDGVLTVKGAKTQLARSFAVLRLAKISCAGKEIVVERVKNTSEGRCEQGLARALVQNMVNGVSKGFSRDLDIQGVGYRAEAKGKTLVLSLGFSHPVEFDIPDGIAIKVDKQTRLTISGADRELVGETAARIRRLKPPEPYQGKGIRYLNEVVRKKAGKAAATGAGAKGSGA